jgi:hypothetical protein
MVAAIVSLKAALVDPDVVAFVFSLLNLACVSASNASWPKVVPPSPGTQQLFGSDVF